MTENLRPEDLTSAVVREVFPPPPPLAGWIGFYYDSGFYDSEQGRKEDAGWYCSGKVHPDREEALCELAEFRPFEGSALVEVGQASALVGTATEKAVCPNCKRDDTGHSWKVNGELRYSCASTNKPAQPEPAAPEMPVAVRNAIRDLNDWADAYREDLLQREIKYTRDVADALESWWRTHAQPVAVGMTEELSMVLLRAEYGATEDERNPNLRDGYVARLKSAIETVRQQAAQVKL